MAATHNFTVTKGDTYNGAVYTVTVNGSAPTTISRVHRQFRRALLGPVVLEWDTETLGGITLTSPSGGVYATDAQVIDVPAGAYVYDDEITFANGTVKTYVEGTMTVEQDVTESD